MVIGRDLPLTRRATRLPGGNGRPLPGAISLSLLTDAHSGLPRLAADRGDVAAARLGHRRVVLVSEPSAVCGVLAARSDTFTKGGSLQGLSMLLGEGLVTSEGAAHAHQRRAIQGHFGQRHEGPWTGHIEAAVGHRTAAWEAGDVLDMEVEMLGLSLDVTLRALFHDVRDRAQLDRLQRAVATLEELSAYSSLPGLPVWMALPLPPVRRFRAAREELRSWARELIARRRPDAGPPDDVLGAILAGTAAGADDAPGGPIDQALTMLVAAHVTTGHALAWALDAVARHPAVGHAMAAEVAGAPAEGAAPGTRELPYCRAVFAETLRLFPPAWVIGRQASEPTEMAGTRIERSDLVLVSPWVTQRDERWFERPDEFRPERWMAEDRPTRFSFFPFGLGARRCVGEPLAWLEGTLTLAALVGRWSFDPLTRERPRPRAGITLSAQGGLPLRIGIRPA
jgi:cytochrome P450